MNQHVKAAPSMAPDLSRRSFLVGTAATGLVLVDWQAVRYGERTYRGTNCIGDLLRLLRITLGDCSAGHLGREVADHP